MSDSFRVMSMDEICAAADAEATRAQACRQWGLWQMFPDSLELLFDNGKGTYLIDLERCGTSAEMLDWIFQLNMKVCTTPQDIGDLVRAFRDIFNPQATLCSFGASRSLDATQYLRRRYPTGTASGAAR